jgi:hypothetical protein
MQVKFEIDDFGDEAASEQAAAAGAAPEEADHLWGKIILEHAGERSVSIEDDLSILGLALCAVVPTNIEAAGKAELRMVGWPGEYNFVADGDAVRVTGTLGEDATFPRQDLLMELHACGERLAACMESLSVGNPQFAFSTEALQKNLAQSA